MRSVMKNSSPVHTPDSAVCCVHDPSYVGIFGPKKPAKKGDTAELPKQRVMPPLSPTRAMQAGRQGNVPDYKKPSLGLSVTQWVRRHVLVEGKDLDRFRQGDMQYLEDLVNEKLAESALPNQYKDQKNGINNFKGKVRGIIKHLFQTPPDLPYEIDHWYVDHRWIGMGLFTTQKIHTRTLGQLFAQNESTNCELLWSEACHEGYDSVYTCNWQESKESAQQKWHLKQHLVSSAKKVKRDHIGFRALFAVYGRLMFANHHKHADFFFENFTPVTPWAQKQKIHGTLTIRPHNKEYWRYLEAHEQILIHYDFNMTFGGENIEDEEDCRVETGGNLNVAAEMMDIEVEKEAQEVMTAEEEAAMVLSELVMEKGRPEDDDLFVPGGKKKMGKKKGNGTKMKKNGNGNLSHLRGIRLVYSI